MERGALAAGPPPPFLPSLFQPFSKMFKYQGSLGWLCGKGMEQWDSWAQSSSDAGLLLCLLFNYFILDYFLQWCGHKWGQ